MGLLKPATNRMAYSKVGIYGTAGSGKSRTATEIAIGLHTAIGSKKPIVVFDTEPAFSFLLPIFQRAGIELLVADESRALADLMTFMNEAEQAADIAIIDSITHVWRDAQESYLSRLNETRKRYGKKPLPALEFQHWRPIKAAWADFTDRFLSSKLHVIVCGRAGQIYEYQDKDDGTGKKELISTGSRMATEKEMGYEPSLLIEMVKHRENGRTVNVALVEKDRADVLNGHEVPMPTYDKLKAHFQALNIGGQHFDSMERRDSAGMFPDADESGWDAERKKREIWIEEITELLKKHHPSQGVEDKQARAGLMEQFFQTRAFSRLETLNADALEDGFYRMRHHLEPPVVEQAAANDAPATADADAPEAA